MRIFEVVLRSGARAEVTAEIFQEKPGEDDRIYFYRDKGLKQLAAYFNRDDVAGIIFGQDNASYTRR
jgi:hypothetical protein